MKKKSSHTFRHTFRFTDQSKFILTTIKNRRYTPKTAASYRENTQSTADTCKRDGVLTRTQHAPTL